MSLSFLSRSIEAKVSELGADELGNTEREVDDVHCDVLIIGSGYGAAVAAARLAGRTRADGSPLRVWVLERGREYLPGSFPETTEQLPSHLRASGASLKRVTGNAMGLFDLRIGGDMTVIAGNGLGGGSLINANVMEMPDPSVWQHHERQRALWPAAIRRDADQPEFLANFATVRRMLGVQQLRQPSVTSTMTASGVGTAPNYPSKAEALNAVAVAINSNAPNFRCVDIAVTLDERAQNTDDGQLPQRQCSHCGNCFTGCNYSAKNSLDRNYLAVARKKGAELFTGATVLGVFQDRMQTSWRVLFNFTDSNLRIQHESSFAAVLTPLKNPPRGFLLRTSKVIIAAGSIGSTEILQKSRAWFGLPVSKRLGQGFSGNGDMIAFGYNQTRTVNPATEESIRPDLRAVGPTIVSMIDLRHDSQPAGRGPVFQDVSVPASLYPVFAEFMTNAAFLSRFERGDARGRKVTEHEQLDPDAIDPFRVAHTQFYAVFGHDRSDGQIRLSERADESNDADGRVDIEWPGIRSPSGVAEFHSNLRYLRGAHEQPQIGGRLLNNPLWQLFGEQTARLFAGRDANARSGAPIAAHPLGGCAMADDIDHGVVNEWGQVFRGSGDAVYDSLVVLDGSIIPGSLGINPALTIAALAERAVAHLVKIWKLPELDAPDAPDALAGFAELLNQPQALSASETMITSGRRPTAVEVAERLLSPAPISLPGMPADVYLAIELSLGPIRDMGVFLASAHRRLPISASQATLTSPTGSARFSVAGYMSVFEEVPSAPIERVGRAALGWLTNAVKRRGGGLPWTQAAFWISAIKAATVIGGQRRFRYEMAITEDVYLDEQRVFQKGDCLKGEKLFTFGLMSNPWEQFMTLRLSLLARDSKFDIPIGTLQTDFSYFANFSSFLLKVVKQGSRTTALLELAGLLTLATRSIFGIHLLNAHTPQSRPIGSRRVAAQQRLPGDIRTRNSGVVAAQPIPVLPNRDRPELQLICTRYPGARSDAAPVLLLHGLTACGNTFTSEALEYGLAAYLHDQGYDVWVAELRTSVALDYWRAAWTFDEVANEDIPAMVSQVQSTTHQKVRVFAHCVGSVMFWSSVLQGKLTGQIERAAFTQVGLATHLPPINNARSRLIGLLREAINLSTFDTNPSDDANSRDSLVERAFTTFPYQRDQWWRLRGKPFATRTWEAQYHRITALHGELMNLRNVSDAVLNDLHRQIGGSNLSTYLHSLYFSRGRVTDSEGLTLVKRNALRERVDFPCFFGAGDRNRVFDPQNAEDSARLLNAAHGYGDDVRPQFNLPHQYASFAGYGHQDTLIGKRSADDVFKPIAAFFAQTAAAQLLQPETRQWTAYASTMGPVIGWLRPTRTVPGEPPALQVRVSFATDRLAGPPRWLLALFTARPRNSPPPLRPLSAHRKPLSACWIDPKGPQNVHNDNPAFKAIDPHWYCLDLRLPDDVTARLDATAGGADLEVFLLGMFDDEAILQRDDCSPAFCALPPELQESIPASPGLPASPTSPAALAVELATAPCLNAEQVQRWLEFIEYQLDRQPASPDSPFRDCSKHGFTRPEPLSRSTSRARSVRDQQFNPPAIVLRREALRAADLRTSEQSSIDASTNVSTNVSTNSRANSSAVEPAMAQTGSSVTPWSGKSVHNSYRPLPDLPRRTAQPTLSFALASCQSMPLPVDSVVAGQSFERLADLINRNPRAQTFLNVPQLLLLIGDQVYLDPLVGLVDAPTGFEKIRQPYQAWLQHASVRRALASIPTYMMLDDHEVQNEWEPSLRADPFTDQALRAFQLYQRSLGPDTATNWYPFWPAGLPFFMLDTRTERSARNLFTRDEAQIIGDDQMSALLDWLKREQLADPVRPKFIVSPSVIVPGVLRDLAEPGHEMSSDGWSGYPKSINQLLSFIAQEKIQGVVFLQGDYHASLVTEVQIAQNAELTDAVRVLSVISSGLYAPYGFVNTQAKDLDGGAGGPRKPRRVLTGSQTHYRCIQSPGMYCSDPNFVVISIDAETSADGKPLWRLVIDISTDSGTLSQAY
jgi:cholesterol oxidase